MPHITEVEMTEIRKRFNNIIENGIKDEMLCHDCFSMIIQCDQTLASFKEEKYITELENIISVLESQNSK